MAGNKIHSDKPFAKGYLCIFEDGSHIQGEYAATITAFMLDTIRELISVYGAAMGTNDIFTETDLFEVLSANIFGAEVIDQFKE